MTALTIILSCIILALGLRALENYHINHTRKGKLDLHNKKQVDKVLRKYKYLED